MSRSHRGTHKRGCTPFEFAPFKIPLLKPQLCWSGSLCAEGGFVRTSASVHLTGDQYAPASAGSTARLKERGRDSSFFPELLSPLSVLRGLSGIEEISLGAVGMKNDPGHVFGAGIIAVLGIQRIEKTVAQEIILCFLYLIN